MEYQFSKRMSTLKSSSIREILKITQNPEVISFAAGSPAPESFPVKEFAELSNEIYEKSPVQALQYNVTEGYTPLLNKISKRLNEKFNVGNENDSTFIVTGGQQGIEFIAKVLCNEGDTIICENPTFVGGMNAFRSYGANLVGIEMDEEGIRIDCLENAINNSENVKMIYLIPTFQNPTGKTMSEKRRKEVYELASKYKLLILEDNPYGELRFAGEDILPIKSMDTENIVIYCGSFSKTLSAGMRLGFVNGPKEIIQKMVLAKQVSDVHTNIYFQLLTDKYLEKYDYDAHIEEIKNLYRKKSSFMIKTIEENFDKRVKFTRPEGGLFLWCTMPDEIDINEFTKRALEKKVAFVPGHDFLPDYNEPCHCFRLNFSTPSDESIVNGIKIIAEVIDEFLNK